MTFEQWWEIQVDPGFASPEQKEACRICSRAAWDASARNMRAYLDEGERIARAMDSGRQRQ